MSYAYPSALPFRPSRRNTTTESPKLLEQIRNALPSWVSELIAELRAPPGGRSRGDLKAMGRRLFRRVATVTNFLILFWFWMLWWGERTVFRESLESCSWENWEKWPASATPHHLAFIADPQLVDPHTYPGRPWPLSTLTVKYTDQYLRRSFSTMQRTLGPDSVVFLGDLFDGGREWATGKTSSPEARYQKYKDSFWKKEYRRFTHVFSNHFNEGDAFSTNPLGRKMIASLPGNHDLGFGSGIQVPVRDRFQTFFGKGNRVDVLGNHTFVSVDTVSLSAMDQPDPKTGSTGAGTGDGEQPNEEIWRETGDFLNDMKVHRGMAEAHELKTLRNQNEGHQFHHAAVDIGEPSIDQLPQPEIVGLPTILLTHVPLYRKAATPCGPYREHYPPSSKDEELEEDEQNALKITGGYQYQNVLTQTISNDLVSKIGPNLVHVYSGDDHDYCEIAHREFSGSPKEITVKSLSWAMGVRRPGFVLTSLWNPIDPATGQSTQDVSPTLQNHLCLLPDQLSIFIYYGLVLGLTTLVLLVRAVALMMMYPPSNISSNNNPILPLSENHSPHIPPTSSTSSSTRIAPNGLASRATTNTAPRYPESYYEKHYGADPGFSRGVAPDDARRAEEFAEIWGILYEFASSVKYVAKFVLAWYVFLIWRW